MALILIYMLRVTHHTSGELPTGYPSHMLRVTHWLSLIHAQSYPLAIPNTWWELPITHFINKRMLCLLIFHFSLLLHTQDIHTHTGHTQTHFAHTDLHTQIYTKNFFVNCASIVFSIIHYPYLFSSSNLASINQH